MKKSSEIISRIFKSEMAAPWNGVMFLFVRSLTGFLPPGINRARLPTSLRPGRGQRTSPSWEERRKRRTLCCSRRQQQQQQQQQEQPEEDGMEVLDVARLASDDLSYLWKLSAGSVGGGAAIKYGSIVFPEMTRPNIVEALLMISLPVLVAVLILIKESSKDNQREDLL